MTSVALLPHAQKSVICQLLGLQVLVPQLAALDTDAAKRLEICLNSLARAALEEPDSTEDIHTFLARLISEIRSEVDRCSKSSQPGVTRVVGEIENLVADFCKSPHDPLERLVEAIQQTSSEFYLVYDAPVPPELWIRTLPCVSFLKKKEGLSFAPEIHLKTWTEFGRGEAPSAKVRLQIVPMGFDKLTMAALPRVVLHEYIAHVPQGPYTASRVHPDASDTFAEGWMDYLAHRVHHAVLERQGPFGALGQLLIPTWSGYYREAAEKFYSARIALRDYDPTAAARHVGAMTACQLHELLRRLPETKRDPDTYLFKMSFGLNSSSRDSIARQVFVAHVQSHVPLASQAELIVSPLRQWARGTITLDEFIDVVLAIRSSTDV